MYTHITVVPEDGLVSVEGVVFVHLDMSGIADAPTIHAIQWHEGKGEIESADYSGNIPFTDEADYHRVLTPYLALWEAAKAEAEKPVMPPMNQAAIKGVFGFPVSACRCTYCGV